MNPAARLLSVVCVALALGGCAPLRSHWPFHARVVPAPVAVHELDLLVPPDAAMPIVLQFWERNTLVLDLQGVTASGSIRIRPRSGANWPVRLSLRATPGRFEALELRGGAQRVVLPVSGDRGSAPLTMPVSPTVYAAGTAELQLRWGAADSF
jgi:hypothetical protein